MTDATPMTNAALFAISMLAADDPDLAERLLADRRRRHDDAAGATQLMLGDGDPHAIGAEIPTDPLQHLLLLDDGDGGVDYHALEGASFLGTGDHTNILCCADAISMARRNNCAGLPPRTLIQCGSFLKRGAVYR